MEDSSINDLLMAARLHMALPKDPKIKLGSLVAPLGRRTQSEGETCELLQTTYFPNSEVTEEMAAPAAALRARRCDWRVAARVVSYIRVEWAIDSFAPYKSPGMEGIFPAMLQEEWIVLSLTLSESSMPACLLAMFQPCGNRLR